MLIRMCFIHFNFRAKEIGFTYLGHRCHYFSDARAKQKVSKLHRCSIVFDNIMKETKTVNTK